MSRLLIIGCSATKTSSLFRIPTHERYDGPVWRSLRAARATGAIDGRVDVYALSAEHGLIPLHSCIHDYDRQMTSERAIELRNGHAARDLRGTAGLRLNVTYFLEHYVLQSMVRGQAAFDECLIVAGAVYLEAIDFDVFARKSVPVLVAAGGIGVKRSTMKTWLAGGRVLESVAA